MKIMSVRPVVVELLEAVYDRVERTAKGLEGVAEFGPSPLLLGTDEQQ